MCASVCPPLCICVYMLAHLYVLLCAFFVCIYVYTYHNHTYIYNLFFLFYHQTIHSVQKSSHPLHWAGFAVIGKDIVLKDNSVELSLAIRSMLQGSLDYAIAALKTMQAMVSESCDLLVESAFSKGRHLNDQDTYTRRPQHPNCTYN